MRPCCGGTGRWSCASAGAPWATPTTPRTRSRPPSSSWHSGPLLFVSGSRWPAGFTESRIVWPPTRNGPPPGGTITSPGPTRHNRATPRLAASWQELQALLDEEIAGLSETLRAPFILCCLESKSYAEAAQQLGIEEGTVRNRLGRARKRLQGQLTRRGVALTTLLAAVAVAAGGAPAAVPRSLAAPIVKAAAQVAAGQALAGGAVSAQVITLVEGVNQAMFVSKCKTAILLLVCTAIVGAGLGMAVVRAAGRGAAAARHAGCLRKRREGSKKERPPPADAPAQAEAKESAKVRGRVLDPDGKPVAGAKLYLGGHTSRKTPTYPARATSGEDGNFGFTFARSDLDKTDPEDSTYQVLAVAEGHGCAWVTADATAGDALTLRLVEDVPVSGRVLDADGRPVAGAKLMVTGVCAAKGGDDGMFVTAVQLGLFQHAFAKGWVGPLPAQPALLTTGADGRFKVSGVGRDRVVSLLVEGRGIATATLGVHGVSFEHQAEVSRPIRGVVRDKDTGKALAGVTVFWQSTSTTAATNWPLAAAEPPRTRRGVTNCSGAPKSSGYGRAGGEAGERGSSTSERTLKLEDAPGLDPLTVDIELVPEG